MFRRLDHRGGHYLLLIGLWAVVCLPNLGGPSLWDIDEGNNAECFREMRASGNLVIPTFNGLLREDKPALLYWLQIASARLFGVNEWAARFPSAVAVLLVVLTLYELGRQTFDARTGLLGGVILATSFSVLGAAHFANPDALLLVFTTLALTLFYHDYRTDGGGWLVGVGIASGLAVLSKGPVGLILPVAVAVLFLAWQRQPSRLLDVRILSLAVAFVLVAAPWYVWVSVETKGAWIAGFWKKHHVERTLTSMESHSGPFYYYALVLAAGLAPWSVFLGTTLWHVGSKLREPAAPASAERSTVRFLVAWFLLYFVFFSLVRTKLPNYILPAYPAAALLVAHLLERWRRGEVSLPAWVVRTSLACLALIGVAVTVALLAVSGGVEVRFLRGRTFPDAAPWALLGAVPVAGAVAGAWLFERGRRGGVIAAVAVAAVLFGAAVGGWGLEAVEEQKAARPLAKALPEDQLLRDVRLATYRYFQPSLVFYCRREVARCKDEREVVGFLQRQLPSFLFVPEDDWAEMRTRVPLEVRVLARRRDLYGGRTIVVVTNERDESARR
jgi:4-amino-4-deoxy-L-arabinose transferase-like glycosyltransferase